MNTVLENIENNPIIPVFYHDDIDTCIDILSKCYEGGIRVFEFVNRGDKAVDNFKKLLALKETKYPDLHLGIGTIKNEEQAQVFAEMGTDFLVSPIINSEIAAVANKYQLLWIPGCMTPTEVALAEQLNAPLIKLFPGNILGPQYLKAIKPIFPDLKFMPTGGVEPTLENLSAWFNSGVSAVGLGSQLFNPPTNSDNKNWLQDRCKQLISWAKS